jgi:tRNA A37 threonylcarbamoyladenosine synthetase subunit TsaC/SUA5/YrdC
VDKSTSTTRHSRLESVILTQTDTTVGFLSQNKKKLDIIKGRPPHKPYLINFLDFATLKQHVRIPNKRKKELRRAKKTTYIVNNQAFRVATPPTKSILFRKYKWFYSTSANKSGASFLLDFAIQKADIIIKNHYGLKENTPSKIFKINTCKKIRLR